MLLTFLLNFLGGSAGGSLLGGLMALLNRRIDVTAKKLDLEQERARWVHEALMRDKDLALANAEAQGKKEVVIVEGDAQFEVARMQAIGASQAMDRINAGEIQVAGRWGWLLVLVLAFSKFIRPAATILVGGAAIWVNLLLAHALLQTWSSLSAEQKLTMASASIMWVSAQASMIFSYWFVARGSSGNARELR